MEHHRPGRAPDFTTACVVMFGVNLAWVMLLLFAAFGLVIALLASLALNHWIRWLELRKHARLAGPVRRD